MIGGSGYARCVAMLLLPMVAACQPDPAAQTAQVQTATTRTADMQTPEPAAPAVAPATPSPTDADAILAENDRAIAENRRVTQTLDGYRRTDGDKLDRLKAGCERTLGAAADRDGAKRIFDCVEAGW